jgi:hypothetical protein
MILVMRDSVYALAYMYLTRSEADQMMKLAVADTVDGISVYDACTMPRII